MDLIEYFWAKCVSVMMVLVVCCKCDVLGVTLVMVLNAILVVLVLICNYYSLRR